MNKLHNDKGFSTVEIFSITGIVIMVLFLVFSGFCWYRDEQFRADDKLLANTAESVAHVQSGGYSCPVRDCSGGEDCPHKRADGSYVGYFDHPTNTIVGTPGKGYNEYKVMTIDGQKYYGEPGTMVIQVTIKNETIQLSWVNGGN